MWASKRLIHGCSVSRFLRATSSIANKVAQLNHLLDETTKSIAEDPIQKHDLAIAVRDEYVRLPRFAGNPIDHERCDALLTFADSSRDGNFSSVWISQDSDRDEISAPRRRPARSSKRQGARNSILIDCILSRDIQKGMEFVVAMREDIFQARKMMNSSEVNAGGHTKLSKLKELDNDLKIVLTDWFCPDMMGKF